MLHNCEKNRKHRRQSVAPNRPIPYALNAWQLCSPSPCSLSVTPIWHHRLKARLSSDNHILFEFYSCKCLWTVILHFIAKISVWILIILLSSKEIFVYPDSLILILQGRMRYMHFNLISSGPISQLCPYILGNTKW